MRFPLQDLRAVTASLVDSRVPPLPTKSFTCGGKKFSFFNMLANWFWGNSKTRVRMGQINQSINQSINHYFAGLVGT